MFNRIHPAFIAFGGSILLLAGLIAALYWDPFAAVEPTSGTPLVVYCAEAMRVPMEATARDYERETGQKVFLHFGASQTILANLYFTKQGDLFLPADDSFIDLARDKSLVATVLPLARMTAVALLRPGYTAPLQTWADLVAEGHTIGLGNTQSTAIGKLVRARLIQLELWEQLEIRQPTYLVSVNDVANNTRLGTIDVGVVWDATAHQHPKLTVVHLPELDSVTARVQIALTKYSTQPDAAMRFVRFLRA